VFNMVLGAAQIAVEWTCAKLHVAVTYSHCMQLVMLNPKLWLASTA